MEAILVIFMSYALNLALLLTIVSKYLKASYFVFCLSL